MVTREQVRADREAGLKRFDRLIPQSSDVLTVILKGHLLIEEKLQSVIEEAVRSPQLVREARLTFYQRLILARAIVGHFNKSVAWDAMESLNAIRNRLVHQAEPAATKDLLAPFLKLCDGEQRFEDARKLPPGLPRVRLYIAFIWVTLETLHQVVRIIREKMPLP